MENAPQLRIGELAATTGVTTQAIRFYEREGLLPRTAREANGYRSYGPEAVKRVNFIRQCHIAGFSLREVKELQRMDDNSSSPCSEMRVELDQKIDALSRQMAALRCTQERLVALRARCERAPRFGCPALDALRSLRE